MPSVGNLIQLTQCSEVLGQQACNVFYFVVAAWTGNLTIEEVLEYWKDTHWAPVMNNMAQEVTGTDITWRNLDNGAEVVTIPNDVDGAGTAEMISPFTAVSVRLYGETSETRSGWKRFAGVTEGVNDNGELSGAFKTDFQADVNVLFADVAADTGVTGTADAWLINTIVGRNPDGTLALGRAQPIVNALLQPRITTQNTRKIGRGS